MRISRHVKKGPTRVTDKAVWCEKELKMHKTTVIGKGSDSPLVTAGKGELKQPALQKSLL